MDIDNEDENQEVEITSDEQTAERSDAESIIDLVADGKASEAREAIYAALYGKVGDRIDELRPEVRSGMVPTDFDDVDLEADVDDSQE